MLSSLSLFLTIFYHENKKIKIKIKMEKERWNK